MNPYPLHIRLERGHLIHYAFMRRRGLMPPHYTTACGHTYARDRVASLAATEGRVCRGCEIAVKEGGFPVLGSTTERGE